MILEPREMILKNGRRCIMRTPRREDGAALLEYMLTLNGETEFVLSYPDEFGFTAEHEGDFLESLAISPGNLMLACFDGERCVGNAQISFNNLCKLKHRSSVAVGVLKEYWGQGIATSMLELLIEVARNRAGVEVVGLEYIEGNDRARALYEKLGFVESYRKPDAIRWRDGSIHAEIGMMKYLKL